MTTLLDLKNRKAELRTQMNESEINGEQSEVAVLIEYFNITDQLVIADKLLMKPVDKCIRCKWLHE